MRCFMVAPPRICTHSFTFELISQGLSVNISDEEQPKIEAVPNSYDPAIDVADTCQTSGPSSAV